MDYIRKKRWVRYPSLKCKMYLRNDFHYECAYCRLREKDTGFLCEEYFQKDHFIPQHSETDADLDAYDNMVYACAKCNRAKSDHKIWEILNPCRDDIFAGEHPHITNGGKEHHYQLVANTESGRQYIEALHLNSSYYTKLREEQEESDAKDEEIKKLLAQIACPDEIAKKLCNTDLHGKIEFRCGKSKAGYAFQDVLAILKQKKLKAELLFEEYEMDISLQYHGELYYCEIKLNETNAEQVAYVRVSEEQKEKWKESGRKCGILYYYIKTGRLDFYRMTEDLPEYVETLK